MAFRKGLHNFSKGELAPELWGRTDIAPYAAGVRRARNVLILKYGGLTYRPGFEFVSPWYDETQDGRLLPFQFDEGKSGQNYALEMGQGYMRPAAGGGMVVEDILTVLGATNTNPVRVNVPFHGYAVGDDWAVSGVLGMVEINDQVWRIVAVPDASHFDIAADGTAWGVFTGDSEGGITRTAAPPPPDPPPVVPPVVEPDPPPVVVPPNQPPRYCVAVESLVLMANASGTGPGEWKVARDIGVGERVWTQHEDTRAWGAYRVERSDFEVENIFSADGFPDASPAHRFASGFLGGWVRMDEIGTHARRGVVWSATIEGAHTYFARHPVSLDGVLSHNIKAERNFEDYQ